jgi:hypothetical protein
MAECSESVDNSSSWYVSSVEKLASFLRLLIVALLALMTEVVMVRSRTLEGLACIAIDVYILLWVFYGDR